jgi:hypothetical protein
VDKIKFIAALTASVKRLLCYTFTSPCRRDPRLSLGGQGPNGVGGANGCLPSARASRCRNPSWPWPPTPLACADQEPNLQKEYDFRTQNYFKEYNT